MKTIKNLKINENSFYKFIVIKKCIDIELNQIVVIKYSKSSEDVSFWQTIHCILLCGEKYISKVDYCDCTIHELNVIIEYIENEVSKDYE